MVGEFARNLHRPARECTSDFSRGEALLHLIVSLFDSIALLEQDDEHSELVGSTLKSSATANETRRIAKTRGDHKNTTTSGEQKRGAIEQKGAYYYSL